MIKKNSKQKILILFLILLMLFQGTYLYAYEHTLSLDLGNKVNEVSKYMHEQTQNPTIGYIGGEWAVIGLARSDYKVPQTFYEKYYSNVEEYLKSVNGEIKSGKNTDYSRIIVALTSIGVDVRNVAGYDLTLPLGDYNRTIQQGLNGPIWALIALDTVDYPIPINKNAKVQATRDMYVDLILDKQMEGGGWSFTGVRVDPDMTAMALQALSKYQKRDDVKKAIDDGIKVLSDIQNENGGFVSWGSENSESCSQVIVALTELGIDLQDPRFVKNGNTLLDNLFSYHIEGAGFKHVKEEMFSNPMATEQGLYAIVAAQRMSENKNPLYNMKDAKKIIKDIGLSKEFGLPKKSNVINYVEESDITINYKDLNNNPYKMTVDTLTKKKILNGKSNDKFEPDAAMTRAEFATIIVKALGIDLQEEKIFKDVNEKDWFFNYISTANRHGIIKGKSKDIFDPQGLITKEEAAVMIKRASDLAGLEMSLDETGIRDILAQFKGYIEISDWAMESVAYCYSNEILDTNDLQVNPKKNVTRAEIAQMIFNMLYKTKLL